MVASALVIMVVVAALAGYFIGSADKARRNANPPDPIHHLPPSSSTLHLFERAAVCTDAPHCSDVGR